MTQVQIQPLSSADSSLFAPPRAEADGAAFAGSSAATPSDGIANMRWPLPPHVLPDPTNPGCPEPHPEPKPGSVASVFDSLIDQLGSMLQNLLGGGSPDQSGASPATRVTTSGRQA